MQQLQLSNRQQVQDLNFQSRQKALAPSRHRENEEAAENGKCEDQADYDEEEEEYEEEEKTSYTSSTTPHSRCSRGVSTDELEEDIAPPTQKNPSESTLNDTHSSSIMVCNKSKQSNNGSKRFEDGDPVEESESAPSRNSVLLQLIACGSSAVAKATKNSACVKQPANSNTSSSSSSCSRAVKRSSNESLHRGVVCKLAVKVAEEEDMINYMSENPRFGNLQAEEKEYFSGSIVESMTEKRVAAQPVLKKSNSYTEER